MLWIYSKLKCKSKFGTPWIYISMIINLFQNYFIINLFHLSHYKIIWLEYCKVDSNIIILFLAYYKFIQAWMIIFAYYKFIQAWMIIILFLVYYKFIQAWMIIILFLAYYKFIQDWMIIILFLAIYNQFIIFILTYYKFI